MSVAVQTKMGAAEGEEDGLLGLMVGLEVEGLKESQFGWIVGLLGLIVGLAESRLEEEATRAEAFSKNI
jgi:hypothetical protein